MAEATKLVDELESKAPTLSWGLRLAAAAGTFDRTTFQRLADRLRSGSGGQIQESLFALVISSPLVERAGGEKWSVAPWFRDVLSERLRLTGNGDFPKVHAVLAEGLKDDGGQQWGEGLDGRQLHLRWLYHSMQADQQRTGAPIGDFMEAYGQGWIGEARAVLTLTERTRPDIAQRDIEFAAAVGLEAYREREWARALQAFESVWVVRECPRTRLVAIALHLLGKMKGNLPPLNVSAEILRENWDMFGVAQVLHTRGQLWGKRGQRQRALADLSESVQIGEKIGDPFVVAQVLHTRGWLLGRWGQREQALDDLSESIRIGEGIWKPFHVAQVLHTRGQLLGRWGQREQALDNLSESIKVGERIGNRFHVAQVLHTRGQLLGRWGQRQQALDDLGTSLQLLREVRDRFGEAQVLHTRGRLLGGWGEVEAALQDLDESIRIGKGFRRFRTDQVERVRDRLLSETVWQPGDEDRSEQ
jgi:tetratricopeptide (TPR) repeat protein